ncbi:hypothetical protein ACIRQF_05760 [Streptomyces sp. NPDC101191]|uniref:hypothetical protein n=1 Tax=Streptomyces sp. NPDC101191 TaxID=3366126 RepID=UPI0037F1B37D
MTRVVVEGTEVVVRLGLREALAARRRTVRVPVRALRGIGVETSWWRVLRGEAGPGRWLPGRCVGTRRGPDGTDFVAVRSDGPALYMDLAAGAPFSRVAVSVPDPDATGSALRAAMPAEPELSDAPEEAEEAGEAGSPEGSKGARRAEESERQRESGGFEEPEGREPS